MYCALVFAVFLFSFGILEIHCGCDFRIDSREGHLERPEIWKKFGSNELKLKLSSAFATYNLIDSPLRVKCANGFKRPEKYRGKTEVNIECKGDATFIDENPMPTPYMEASCNFYLSNLKLFEAKSSFSWCNSNFMSYLVVEQSRNDDILEINYIAGICYDIKNMKLISVLHSLRNSNNIGTNTEILKNYQLGQEIRDIKEAFPLKQFYMHMYDVAATKEPFQFADYKFSPVIQTEYLSDSIRSNFGSLLDIIWLSKLREGNWKHYETELIKQNEKEPFTVMAGTSKVTKIPFNESVCQGTMELKNTKASDDVPLLIWNYLQSTVDPRNKYVIIGVNTQFPEAQKLNDIEFCRNICNEINWLKNISSRFDCPALGQIICCSADDVALSQHLEGFTEALR